MVKEFSQCSHVAEAAAFGATFVCIAARRMLVPHFCPPYGLSPFYLIKSAHFYIFAKFLISIISVCSVNGFVVVNRQQQKLWPNDIFEYVVTPQLTDTHTHTRRELFSFSLPTYLGCSVTCKQLPKCSPCDCVCVSICVSVLCNIVKSACRSR